MRSTGHLGRLSPRSCSGAMQADITHFHTEALPAPAPMTCSQASDNDYLDYLWLLVDGLSQLRLGHLLVQPRLQAQRRRHQQGHVTILAMPAATRPTDGALKEELKSAGPVSAGCHRFCKQGCLRCNSDITGTLHGISNWLLGDGHGRPGAPSDITVQSGYPQAPGIRPADCLQRHYRLDSCPCPMARLPLVRI